MAIKTINYLINSGRPGGHRVPGEPGRTGGRRDKKLEPQGAEGFLHRLFFNIARYKVLVQMGEEIIDYLAGGDRDERSLRIREWTQTPACSGAELGWS